MIQNPLLDLDFLQKLDESRNRVIYARIIALTFDEDPVETIEGKITGGTISIDGSSAVRRSCSGLSLVAKDINVTDYYWGLNTKFKLEIGLETELTEGEIVWFPQGVYLITAFSTSYSTSGFTINISGQDKMCLLNGTIGGTISAPTDFANIEEVNTTYVAVEFSDRTEYAAMTYYLKDKNDNYTIASQEYNEDNTYYEQNIEYDLTPIPIKTIIREAVNTYANEPYYNIIINDVDETGLELLEYRADSPIYLFFENKDTFTNFTLNGDMKCYIDGAESTLSAIPKDYLYSLIDLTGFDTGEIKTISFLENGQKYIVAKCEYGDTAGYRLTELTYPGELTAQVGDNITSAVLDKIVNMLGDYQYYYNLQGQFVFERKGTYLNTSWDSLIDTEDDTYAENAAYAEKVIYNFERNKLISSISNNPQLSNIRNDFSVFGERDIGNDKTVAIHARIAIDKKPDWYVTYDGIIYCNKDAEEPFPDVITSKKIVYEDWRELIYQMALDFYKHNQEDDFLYTVQQNNTLMSRDLTIHRSCINGKTGYEQYYIDMQAFWRQLYNPNPEPTYEYKGGKYMVQEVPLEDSNVTGAYEKAITWVSPQRDWSTMTCDVFLPLSSKEHEDQPAEYFTENSNLYYWNRNIIYNPSLLNFWIDFLSVDGNLGKYSIKTIGDRPKAINDTDVNSIYYRTTPNILYFDSLDDYNNCSDTFKTGYTYVILPSKVKNMFTISAQGKSAKDVIDTYLYQHTYGQDTVSLSTIPIYYLEPNNRIKVYDQESQVNGEYLISRISIPLSYSGMMSIEATKAPQRII